MPWCSNFAASTYGEIPAICELESDTTFGFKIYLCSIFMVNQYIFFIITTIEPYMTCLS